MRAYRRYFSTRKYLSRSLINKLLIIHCTRSLISSRYAHISKFSYYSQSHPITSFRSSSSSFFLDIHFHNHSLQFQFFSPHNTFKLSQSIFSHLIHHYACASFYTVFIPYPYYSLLILSFVSPLIYLNILISAKHIICSIFLSIFQHS